MKRKEKPSPEVLLDPETDRPVDPKSAPVDPDDAPELDDQWFEEADVFIGDKLVRRGRPKSPNAKYLVSLRLSPEVLQHFRAGGPGWQTRIDEALRAVVAAERTARGEPAP